MKTQKFKGESLSQTKVKNNILKMWELTQLEERTDWYQEAYDWAKLLANTSGYSTPIICGVIASLSPVKTWSLNLVCAKDMVMTGNCGHMEVFKNKALLIMNCDGSDAEILRILKGNKISAFYINIRYPQRNEEVTIDRHALSIALGRWITDEDYAGMTTKQYDFFVYCYKIAAKKLGVSPVLVQSATWVRFRKIKREYKQ